MKKNWNNPIIFFDGISLGPGDVEGPGSGQGGEEQWWPSFMDWCMDNGYDYTTATEADWNDYVEYMSGEGWYDLIKFDEKPQP